MRAVSAKSNSSQPAPDARTAETEAAGAAPAVESDMAPFDAALLQRWFDAMRAAEPSASAVVAFADNSEGALRAVAAHGLDGEAEQAIVSAALGARDRASLQLAPLKAGNRTVLAAPLRSTGRKAVVALVLERSVSDASRFAPSFQLSLVRLGDALDQRPRSATGTAMRGLSAADALELLRSPDGDSFAAALYDKLEAALKPDTACLVEVKGSGIRLLRSSARFDPLPRGSRIGHSRRAALVSVAAGQKVLATSWSEPRLEHRSNVDLGMLCSTEGPQRAVAATLPDPFGKGRLVFLGEYLDRTTTALDPVLEPVLADLGEAITSLHGKRRRPAQSANKPPLLRRALQLGAAVLVAAALVWVCLPAPLLITGEATLESSDQRSVVAPGDGILAKANFEPGQTVHRGDVLAEFDTRELRLRHNSILAQLAQAQARKQTAIATFKAADIAVVDAEIDALNAQSDLVDLMLDQSRVVASEDAVVLSGNMTERVGSAMRKGELMFELAPLSGYSVSIEAAQQDINSLAIGQKGELKLTAMPFDDFPVGLQRISPAASDNSPTSSFNIRASLDAQNPLFRPGMKGVVHIEAGQSIRAWVLSRDFIFWARMQLWRWIA